MRLDPFSAAARRLHPAYFARSIDPKFSIPDHLLVLSKTIREVVYTGGGFILCSLPPRHGKSTLSSHWAPLWYLDLKPEKHVILLSHTGRYAETWGRRARNRLVRNERRFNIRIDPSSKSVAEWTTTAGGGMVSVGVGGPVTGRGGDLIILDDPVKDAKQANSAVWRDSTWEWWQETVFTRREPGATVLAIMTRWHEDDFAGRILSSEEAHEWRVITLPALSDPSGDLLGRAGGDALWPERFPVEELERIRRHIGPYAWEALYQQRPRPPKGSMFWGEKFGRWRDDGHAWTLSNGKQIPKAAAWIGQITDTAMVDEDTADWTVVLTFAAGPRGEFLVLDVARDRLEVPDQWAFVMAAREKWRREKGYRWIGVENKNSGLAVLQLARRQGLPMREIEAIGDKVTRASAASVHCANGMIFLPASAPWLAPYEHELISFPRGAHDDQVDVTAYGVLETNASRELVGRRDDDDRPKLDDDEPRKPSPFSDRLAGGGVRDDRLSGGRFGS